MKRIVCAFFALFVSASLFAAELSEKEIKALAKATVEKYYESEQQEHYGNMFKLFRPGATVRLEMDFGSYAPSNEMEFYVEAPESFVDDSDTTTQAMKTVKHSAKVGKISVDGDQITVKSKVKSSYLWDGYKGKMKAKDMFQLELSEGKTEIVHYQSSQTYK